MVGASDGRAYNVVELGRSQRAPLGRSGHLGGMVGLDSGALVILEVWSGSLESVVKYSQCID